MIEPGSSDCNDKILSALADREFLTTATFRVVGEALVKNVPPAEAKERTVEFVQILSTLASQAVPESRMKEMLTRAYELARLNIEIRHEFFECLIVIARGTLGTEISEIALRIADVIIYTRPRLGVEIVDSDQCQFILSLMSRHMTRTEMFLFQHFTGSSENVAEIIAQKYGFITEITKFINDATSIEHFVQLMDCLIDYVLTLPETSDCFVPIFTAVIPNHIFSKEPAVVQKAIYLYKVLLESAEEAVIVNFMFESDCDTYLFNLLDTSQTFMKEQILGCFHNISGDSMQPTRLLFQRDVEKFAAAVPHLGESCQIIVMKTICNMMTLGVDEAIAIINLGFLDLARNFLANGSLKSHDVALQFNARLCEYISKDPQFEAFVEQSHILETMVGYLDIPKRSILTVVISSLSIVASHVRDKYTGNIFTHPLFANIDMDELYDKCSTIASEPNLDQTNKALYQDVLNLLEYMDTVRDDA